MTLALIPSHIDAAFRKALIDVAPVTIRPKIREALANGPQPDGRAHAARYFGAELADVVGTAAPLADWLDQQFRLRLRMPGLLDWLNATGYGNDYRMLKAFHAWAHMKRTPGELVH